MEISEKGKTLNTKIVTGSFILFFLVAACLLNGHSIFYLATALVTTFSKCQSDLFDWTGSNASGALSFKNSLHRQILRALPPRQITQSECASLSKCKITANVQNGRWVCKFTDWPCYVHLFFILFCV